ncbi:aspartate aminotransferase family protein (plasmid) [Ralstonia pseudosolanacearum]|uniref:Diaminobutyrate--2-oxoglutarate transaminase n=1 Tax=Ralstonia solanacearum TaxID=305 RepID=A0AA92JWT2_RALSL|nr:aminotransferase class III-fold pyridoxal phosphate-dependent enzyme [Ralstonia pseudosolanacearum]QOK94282.1 aspartate aminotransferase family protein [Ralstonia pseudosolanacearum]QOK99157.1 aspartate aminotransferase family protein [Ralstonia pseudosolanacearum]
MSLKTTLDSVRRHQSKGRAMLYAIAGVRDCEDHAQGCWVRSTEGRSYLDFGSFSVFLLGHRHPAVIDAVGRQLMRLPVSSRTLPSPIQAQACEALAAFAPPNLSKVMLLNSGSEAVEAALKLAKAKTERRKVIYLEKSYHGKTLGALSVTDAAIFRRDFIPDSSNSIKAGRTDVQRVSELIVRELPAAVILEPIQGEGGIYEVPPSFRRAVRTACNQVGAVLIHDEIQCGLGRSGERWASLDIEDALPDILIIGKGLGGGVLPVSALMASADTFTPYDQDPLLHSTTFGGNPLACVALMATLDIVERDQLWLYASALGRLAREGLAQLVERHPDLFCAVSGRGLMLGLHCRSGEVAAYFIRRCAERHLLLTPCLTTPDVIRFTPPLVATEADVEFSCDAMEKASRDVKIDLV